MEFSKEQIEAIDAAWKKMKDAYILAEPEYDFMLKAFKGNLGIKEAVTVRPGDLVKDKHDGRIMCVMGEDAISKGWKKETVQQEIMRGGIAWCCTSGHGHPYAWNRFNSFTDMDGNPIGRVEY